MEEAAVDKAIAILSEHFETVQVFVTRYVPNTGDTVSWDRGTGNWLARYGHVRMWLIRKDEIEREAGQHGEE